LSETEPFRQRSPLCPGALPGAGREDRIVGGVGVHAPGPVLVLLGVAGLAGAGIHQRRLRQRRRRRAAAGRRHQAGEELRRDRGDNACVKSSQGAVVCIATVGACHNRIVSPRRGGPFEARALVLGLVVPWIALTPLACKKSAASSCTTPPPVDPACPEAGAPSFTSDVLPIFNTICVNCHRPGGQESKTLLTNYAQIHGDAQEVFNQVFLSCAMPPPGDASPPLTDDERQTLLDWLACGAPDDSPAKDAGTAGD
jgi:hypothetical protein